VRTPQK